MEEKTFSFPWFKDIMRTVIPEEEEEEGESFLIFLGTFGINHV